MHKSHTQSKLDKKISPGLVVFCLAIFTLSVLLPTSYHTTTMGNSKLSKMPKEKTKSKAARYAEYK